MRITIPGDAITKKNSQRLVTIGGRPRILPSKQYEKYERAAAPYILPHKPEQPIDFPVTVKCVYFRSTRRRVDLVNLLEGTADLLVHYGLLKDDHSGIIVSHDGSRVRYDKGNPRTEIEILPYVSEFDIGDIDVVQ